MKFPITFYVQPRLFAFLVIGFVIATIVGTVSHEMGHYLPAKRYGYNPQLHYQKVSYGEGPEDEKMTKFYELHKAKIILAAPSPEKSEFNHWLEQQKIKGIIVTLGGPLQTMVTGSIGFLLLWFNRKKIRITENMSFGNWVLVLLCFFWSRQVSNMILWTGDYLLTGRISYRGDEIKLSRYLFGIGRDSSILALGSIGFITGIIAAILLIYTVFYIIPKYYRLTFLLAGIAGSTLGWIIWMETLGPALLP